MDTCADLFRQDTDGVAVGGEVGGKVYLLIVMPIWLKIVHRHVPVVPHAAEEDVCAVVKAATEALYAVVPLADLHGMITVF